VTGAQLGLLQGGGRWRDFAVLSVASGAGRLVLGAAGILVSPTPLGAMSGVALGAVVPVLVGHRLAHVARSGAGPAEPWRDVGREVMHASHTLLAFFALTQADVFVARAVLPATESGLYAAGLIITKAVLFLPTFVTVMAFPALSRRGGRRHLHHLGLLLVLAIGLVAVAGVLLLPGLALAFVGGPAYAQVQPYLWLFAVLGTLGAMLQLLVQTALARRHRWAVAWVWLALGSVVAAAPFVGSGRQLLLVVLTVAVALLAALVVVTWSDEVQADPDSGVPGADTGTPRPATASGTSAGPTADPGPVSAPRRARSDRPPR
jgi:O-antigen/teichoic acid export membrane protein